MAKSGELLILAWTQIDSFSTTVRTAEIKSKFKE